MSELEQVFEEIKYKIFARTNADGIVIKIFGDAFDTPTSEDVLLKETYDRHGANAYQVVDENGFYNYEIVNGRLTNRDKSVDITKLNAIVRIAELKANLESYDYYTNKKVEGLLTDERWNEIVMQRQAWRDEINLLEKE